MRSGNNFFNHKGGCGPLVYDENSPTQTTFNMETLFVFKKRVKKEDGKCNPE